MKHLLWVIAIPCFLACSNETVESKQPSEKSKSPANSSLVDQFLANTSFLEEVEGDNPIESLAIIAEKQANQKINFGKNNIKSVLKQAKEYSGFFIIVENHTIVKIDDLDNCNPSGSWNACMPFGEGYIKKGKLVQREDYINNIIGLPDSQQRTAYLFN